MKMHLKLLKTNRNFMLISAIQLICYFGAWFSQTGIFTLLIELKAPVWAITISAAMAFIPGIILAPFSGILIDKFRAKPMLVVMILIECISVLVLIFINSLSLLWLLLLIIFVRMGVSGVHFQVEMSVLPKILTPSELKIANEIHSIIWAVAYTAGMGLSGIYIHFFGVKSAFLFDCGLYLVGFAFLLSTNLPNSINSTTKSAISMLKDGLRYINQNRVILHLILLHSFVGLVSYDALIALLADYHYKGILSTALLIGFTNASRAIALIAGPAILSKIVNSKNLHIFYIGQGVGIIIWACLQFNFYLGFIGMFFAGFFTSTLWSYTYTMLQQKCDEKFYGRVIAYNDMCYLAMSAFVSLAIGLLFELGLSLWLITIFMGIIFFIGAMYYNFVEKNYNLS
ncbi:MFS transporter [Campylobacter mucosalis]|uniref:H+ antiporter protein, major facilitator superfamily n=1 Tax=Campylobacter mucosalis CCUG 21559 TaxID=1032067 RepID=A0A6G5QI81_9BACT|nr:MFS transporter [Campylobacter mucosalis]KEA46323.1 MFS transporter [Campylobacter mucosalis]QCD45287.1 H+ antiporter protein, major facilitator superfamily [Campylobacter mucosalis CCUG 21559]QKF63200.1 proton antiporter protein, major facilitator superfamily [Campylobacter mucosalis]